MPFDKSPVPLMTGGLARSFLRLVTKYKKVEDGRLIRRAFPVSSNEEEVVRIVGIDPGRGDATAMIIGEVREGGFFVTEIRRNVTAEEVAEARRQHELIP